MSIIGQDDRTEIVDVTSLEDPLHAVVAVDVVKNNDLDIGEGVGSNQGSGIAISPYHILTAAHVAVDRKAARITLAKDVPNLPIRPITRFPLSDANANRSSGGTLGGDTRYNGKTRDGYDLGLITLSNGESIIDSSRSVGLLAFENPDDAQDYTVTTAGYPAFVTEDDVDVSNNARHILRDDDGNPLIVESNGPISLQGTDAQVLFTATGTIDEVLNNGILRVSNTLDGEPGQSGSGYWTTLEGDEPRVLGVVSFQNFGSTRFGVDSDFGEDNFAASIDTDFYDRLVEKMRNRLDKNSGNDLPENAIIGSDENDEIEGTYRRERILGNGGQDTISGGEADDRLEGGAGYDVLSGGKGKDLLQGDGANDYLNGGEGDNDVAVFSDEFKNYDYFELTGSTFGVEENGLITIEHVDGTYADGRDTLVGIEWAQFQDTLKNIDDLGSGNDGGNQAFIPESEPETVTRIIPLPLEDGVEDTKSVEVINHASNLYSYNPPASPKVSLTTPVSMLDGDIDYSLDILMYEPGSENNIVYIMDTSASMNAGELQTVKSAYIDLINYHIDSGLAQNSKFGVVQFSTNATSYYNLTAEEAISTIETLTTSTNAGTVYDGGLDEGLSSLAQSSLDVFDTNNIVYFVSGDVSNKVSY
ncbi:MAG: VWA domain-containing protein, partial [Cyanobacteria bacterium J06631_2]